MNKIDLVSIMHTLPYPPITYPTDYCTYLYKHVHQDQEATATEVVTRKVRQTDPSISDEKARSALGALGLIGEKAIRKVGHLSGTDLAL
jgi:ATPase subunit of ABC transporter with duplicated ATPase domains